MGKSKRKNFFLGFNVIGVREINLREGKSQEVYVLDGKKQKFRACTNLSGSIGFTKSLFQNFDEKELASIIYHERYHKNLKAVLLYLAYLFSWSSILLQYGPFIILRMYYLHTFFIFWASYIFVRWIVEIDADMYAVKMNGKDNMLSALNKISLMDPNRNSFKNILILNPHPPDSLRIKLVKRCKGD